MANLPKFRPVMLNAPRKPALRALVRPAPAPSPPRRRVPSPSPPPTIRKREASEPAQDEFRGSLEPRTLRREPRQREESYSDETMTAVRPVDPGLLRASQELDAIEDDALSTGEYDSVTKMRIEPRGRREQSGASVVSSLPRESIYEDSSPGELGGRDTYPESGDYAQADVREPSSFTPPPVADDIDVVVEPSSIQVHAERFSSRARIAASAAQPPTRPLMPPTATAAYGSMGRDPFASGGYQPAPQAHAPQYAMTPHAFPAAQLRTPPMPAHFAQYPQQGYAMQPTIPPARRSSGMGVPQGMAISVPPPAQAKKRADIKRIAWFVVGMAVGMVAMFAVYGRPWLRGETDPSAADDSTSTPTLAAAAPTTPPAQPLAVPQPLPVAQPVPQPLAQAFPSMGPVAQPFPVAQPVAAPTTPAVAAPPPVAAPPVAAAPPPVAAAPKPAAKPYTPPRAAPPAPPRAKAQPKSDNERPTPLGEDGPTLGGSSAPAPASPAAPSAVENPADLLSKGL